MKLSDKIYVAGSGGMVGSAIERALRAAGYENVIGRTHRELDLTRQAEVEEFFAAERPEYVFLAAAKVGEPLRSFYIHGSSYAFASRAAGPFIS